MRVLVNTADPFSSFFTRNKAAVTTESTEESKYTHFLPGGRGRAAARHPGGEGGAGAGQGRPASSPHFRGPVAGRCALRSPAAHLRKGRGGPPSAARLLALQLPPRPGPAAGSSPPPVSPARRRGPGAGAFPFGLTVHTQVLERCRARRTDTHMNSSATARPGPAGLLQTLSDLPFPCHWTYRLLLVGRLQTSLPDRGSSVPWALCLGELFAPPSAKSCGINNHPQTQQLSLILRYRM